MPKENIDTIMFAPCGMNCMVCYKHCYHKSHAPAALNSDIGKPEHCRKCAIKDCVRDKGLSYCFECSGYPCKDKNLEKVTIKGIRPALWKTAGLFVNMVWNGSWNSRKKNIPVPNAGYHFYP